MRCRSGGATAWLLGGSWCFCCGAGAGASAAGRELVLLLRGGSWCFCCGAGAGASAAGRELVLLLWIGISMVLIKQRCCMFFLYDGVPYFFVLPYILCYTQG
jgi:hypothetical protein